jgi:hypothetical protein
MQTRTRYPGVITFAVLYHSPAYDLISKSIQNPILAAEKIVSRNGITGVGWVAGSASVSQERRMSPIVSCHILGCMVGLLDGRSIRCPIVQVANSKQTAVWPLQSPSQPHPTRPGLTDSTAHQTSLLQFPHDIGLPHIHTRTQSHVPPARPPARSKTDRPYTSVRRIPSLRSE